MTTEALLTHLRDIFSAERRTATARREAYLVEGNEAGALVTKGASVAFDYAAAAIHAELVGLLRERSIQEATDQLTEEIERELAEHEEGEHEEDDESEHEGE